jgi:predicted RNA-binding Zn ribbon-like protein
MDGERLALDLSATMEAGRDLLDGPRGLERWLTDRGIEDPGLSLRLADFRALRGAIRSALAAAVGGRAVPPDAMEALNAASAAAPRHARLEIRDGEPCAIEAEAGPPASRVFARIARSAIELLGGPARERLRSCPAPRCGRTFLATRPRQRWCSAACGNRVRVARHHERRRPRPTLRA